MAFSASRLQSLLPSIGAAVVAGGIALIYACLLPESIAQGDSPVAHTTLLSDTKLVKENSHVRPELTHSVARRALKGFSIYRQRFSDADLYASETIDDSIANSARGRAFLSDLKGLGFETISHWRSILIVLDLTFRAMMQFEDDDLFVEEPFNVSIRVSPNEPETNTWWNHRNIVTDLLQNEVDRAVLQALVMVE